MVALCLLGLWGYCSRVNNRVRRKICHLLNPIFGVNGAEIGATHTNLRHIKLTSSMLVGSSDCGNKSQCTCLQFNNCARNQSACKCSSRDNLSQVVVFSPALTLPQPFGQGVSSLYCHSNKGSVNSVPMLPITLHVVGKGHPAATIS